MAENPKARLERLRRLSELRKKMSTRSPEVMTVDGPPASGEFSIPEKLLGSMDAALSLGSEVIAGIPNLTIGGLAAIGDVILRESSGYGNATEDSQQIVEDWSMVPSYSPRTESGQRTTENVGKLLNIPFEWLGDKARTFQGMQTQLAAAESQRTGEEYQPPSALIPTAITMAPDIVGALIPFSPGRMASRGRDVARIERQASESNIDLGAPYEQQIEQLAAEGKATSGTGMEGIGDIQALVRKERTTERQRIGEIFTEGKEGAATIPSSESLQLGSRLEDSVAGMTTSDFASVNRVIRDAKALPLPEKWSDLFNKSWNETPLNDVMELRMTINADLPSDRLSPEYKALSSQRVEIDSFLQDAFDRDMINGSPASLERWREGFSEWGDFKDLFDDNNTIRKIWQDDLTPEQVKRLIFNKNAVNPGADAGTIIQKLQTILEDTPAGRQTLNTLRLTMLEDLMRPLTGRTPNPKKFAQQWDDFKSDNPSLIDGDGALFNKELLAEIDDFADISFAIGKTAPIKIQEISLARIASVFTLGNQLARSAARVAFGKKVAAALFDPSRKNVVMSEILGYNPRSAMIPARSVERVAGVETIREEENGN